MAVHGTRNRESVSWDYAGILQVLGNVARDHTGLPLLRCYWYEATVEGRRSSEHEILAGLPGVKLRLGKMKPGRREGVEGEIHRDLTTLARNRAISDALVVSAEEDLAQAIADVQDLGLRVILVHIAAPGWTAATALRQECDEIVEISEAHLRPSVELVVGAEPVSEDERQAVPAYASRAPANGHGTPGVMGQPALPVGSHAAPPALYTGSVIAEYQRAAQPANSHRPPLADAPGPAVAGNHSLAPRRAAAGDGAAGCGGPARHGTGRHARPARHLRPAGPAASAGGPAASAAGPGGPGASGPAARPGSAVRTGRRSGAAQPGCSAGLPRRPARAPCGTWPPCRRAAAARGAGPADDASGPADDDAGPASARPRSGTRLRAACRPATGRTAAARATAAARRRAARGPAVGASRVRARARPARPAASAVHDRAADGRTGPAGTACARAARCPGGSARVPGARRPARSPAPQARQGMPAYQAAPPPPPPAPAPVHPAALAPSAAPPGFPGQAADVAPGQAPAVPRPPTAGAPPGPALAPAARRGSGRPGGPPRPAASRCAWRIPGGTARPPARRGGRSAGEAVPGGAGHRASPGPTFRRRGRTVARSLPRSTPWCRSRWRCPWPTRSRQRTQRASTSARPSPGTRLRSGWRPCSPASRGCLPTSKPGCCRIPRCPLIRCCTTRCGTHCGAVSGTRWKGSVIDPVRCGVGDKQRRSPEPD